MPMSLTRLWALVDCAHLTFYIAISIIVYEMVHLAVLIWGEF
jgi:hypothetical protein